jgi:hypothetical protein
MNGEKRTFLTVVVTHDEVCGSFFDGPDSR